MSRVSKIVLVHVGPVQDFIASARRCRDLWFGSRMLSEVARAAAEGMARAAKAPPADVLVFPGSLNAGASDVSVANKIQLCLPPDADAETIAEAGRQAMRAKLTELSEKIFGEVSARVKAPEDFDNKRAMSHVRQMMEFMWVCVEVEGDLSDDHLYATARARAESLLAARKNTRLFNQHLALDAGTPKSSLDGARPSVIGPRVYRGAHYTDSERYDIFKVRAGERLCGVGVLKRLGALGDDEHFHSTSHIASAPTRCALSAAGASGQVALDALVDAFGEHDLTPSDFRVRAPKMRTYAARDPRFDDAQDVMASASLEIDGAPCDGIMMFPSRVGAKGASSLLAQRDWSSDEPRDAAAAQIQRAQRDLLRAIYDRNVEEPFAYYAMLLADGDRMGRAIDALGNLSAHRELSRRLDADFAQRCGDIIAEHGGSLIYAGGDDVLALVPMHTAIQSARALEQQFNKAMSFFDAYPAIERPTLSVGLAIAHHMQPMGEVRALAKRAEHLAKQSGRNRLAVVVKKRGGSAREICGEWTPEGQEPLDERLYHWGRLLSSDVIPNRLASRLRAVIEPFEAQISQEPQDLTELCKSLVRGVLNRRDFGSEQIQDIDEQLMRLYDVTVEVIRSRGQHTPAQGDIAIAAVKHMAEELEIAEEFARAWDAAWPPHVTTQEVI